MALIYTKPAADVFAPTTAAGGPRGASMDEARTWGTEVEGHLDRGVWRQVASWTYSTSVATVVFTDLGAYSEIALDLSGVSCSAAAALMLRTSADGTTFATSGYVSVGEASDGSHAGTSDMLGMGAWPNIASALSGRIVLLGLGVAAMKTVAEARLRDTYAAGGGGVSRGGGGRYDTARAEIAIQFLWSSGNFDAGVITVLGRG